MSHRYLLQPKGNGSKSKSDDLGSLRVKLTYIEDTVLPSACYTALCNLLLKSPDVKVKKIVSWNETFVIRNVFDKAWFFLLSAVLFAFPQPISASAGHILGDIYRERYEAILPMVRLLLHHNRFVSFVSAVVALELENTQWVLAH